MWSIIAIVIIGAFFYTLYCVFKKDKPFKYRLKMLAIAFIGLPLILAGVGMFANLNDPERYAKAMDEAMTKAENASSDAEIIKALRDFRKEEKVKDIYTDALTREVQRLPSSDIDGNIKGYEELAELLPDNLTFKEKVAFYETKMVEKREAEKQEREKRAAENKAIKDANKARKEMESNHVAYCKQIIETTAKFPTEADFDFGYEYFRKSEKRNVVTGRVKLMNGFGALIPHKYSCEFEGITLINADAVPG